MMDKNGMKIPCYVFDEAELKSRVQKIKDMICQWGGKTCFAIKANPFLIPSLMPIVDKFEVCSPGELEICRNYKVPGKQVLFSGVVKTKKDIETALKYPVDVITLESMTHWLLLKECLQECPDVSQVKILPRLSNGAQFGMEEEQVLQIVEEQQSMEQVYLEGIHYFTGTQKKGKQYEKEISYAALLVEKIKENYGLKHLILEYGPGLAVPYFTVDNFENPLGLMEQLRDFILEQSFGFGIDIEMGRYMAASCGKYYTCIVDIKSADERNYCLVDGGGHHVNYYGSNMAMRTPIIKHIKISDENSKTDEKEYMVCGALCTFADILARGISLKNPQIGDMLVFENIGAYSVTEGNYLFLSRDLPTLYMKKENGELVEIRESISSYKINLGNEADESK